MNLYSATQTTFPNHSATIPLFSPHNPQSIRLPSTLRLYLTVSGTRSVRILSRCSPSDDSPTTSSQILLRQFTASAILVLGLGVHACSAATSSRINPPVTVADYETVSVNKINQKNDDIGKSKTVDSFDDEDIQEAFEKWKSKTYALTVPLRIISLRGSVPPLWIKDFIRSQGKRMRLLSEFRGSLENIFFELSRTFEKGKIGPKSAVAADIITIGDTWLNFAINKSLIDPIQAVEDQDWFRSLSDKWKVYLRRNSEGKLDSEGRIWAVPYRFGSMVIAFKKKKFQKHNLPPIEDWADLWKPELAGKISMVDSPREVVGAVLKYLGASYNTKNIESQVLGGRLAVKKNLSLLQKQVRLFDNVNYLKAFGVGDVWVAVGWSNDVLPVAKRMSNVAVIVPKSGASLWADLWAIPAASRIATDQIGGRVRGPSPLVHQWIDFCLQDERALPFQQEIIPGANPSTLEACPLGESKAHNKGPKLDTNLIYGVPPAEILARCEFLEPLSDAASSDYQWLIAGMQRPSHGVLNTMQVYIQSVVQTFREKVQPKLQP